METKGSKMMKIKNSMVLFILLLIVGIVTACGGGSDPTDSDSSSSDGGNAADSDEIDSSVSLVVVDAGGESGESILVGYIDPFTEKTGVEVIQESPYQFGKLQAMVESGQHLFDVTELTSAEMYLAVDLDLVQELDWDKINPDPIFEEARQPYGIGWQYYSTVMAWKDGTTPLETWADFWDVEKFPGKRALPDNPVFTLPIALLADGVPIDELYPLDMDRAFASLEKIKDHVSIWWEAGSQPPQLLQDGEVDYVASWSGRVVGQEGITATYNQGLLDLSFMVIPKGTDNLNEIFAFFHEMTVAENQLKAAEVLPYSGPSKELNDLLSEEQKQLLPTAEGNYEVQALQDGQWWHENGQEAEERWQQFKLSLN